MNQFSRIYLVSLLAALLAAGGLGRADENAGAPAVKAASGDVRPGLVVIGVACANKDKEWREGMVGFGIGNWIAQAFYDTGRYRMFEEKPEVLAALPTKVDSTFDAAAANKNQDLAAIAKAAGADFVAVGRVNTMYTRTSGVSFAIINNQQRDTIVKIELCLFDARTGKTRKVEGKGKVKRSSSAIGADFGGNKIPFDPATVGPATNLAAEEAVRELVPGYRARNRSDEVVKLAKPLVVGVLPLGLKPEVASLFPTLKTKRVALGIHSRIVKTVSGTPQIALQEINPEILEALELQWWMGSTGAPPAEEVNTHTAQLAGKLNWVIYGEVFSFAVSQLEKLSGLSGKVNSQVTISVQLRACDPSVTPARYFVASGTGKAAGDWESWKGDAAEMEQTFVGKAAADAIASAWPALLREMAASPGSLKQIDTK